MAPRGVCFRFPQWKRHQPDTLRLLQPDTQPETLKLQGELHRSSKEKKLVQVLWRKTSQMAVWTIEGQDALWVMEESSERTSSFSF